jgi:hypothetical protein
MLHTCTRRAFGYGTRVFLVGPEKVRWSLYLPHSTTSQHPTCDPTPNFLNSFRALRVSFPFPFPSPPSHSLNLIVIKPPS